MNTKMFYKYDSVCRYASAMPNYLFKVRTDSTFSVLHYYNNIPFTKWPFFLSIAIISLLLGLLLSLCKFVVGSYILVAALLSMLRYVFGWFEELHIEARLLGKHTRKIKSAMLCGFFLFLCSEATLFAGFFWSMLDRIFSASSFIGFCSVPSGLERIEWYRDPLKATIVLLSSGYMANMAYYCLLDKRNQESDFYWGASIILGLFFLFIQYHEYHHLHCDIGDSVWYAHMYLLTGFHGFHVIVGLLFLSYRFADYTDSSRSYSISSLRNDIMPFFKKVIYGDGRRYGQCRKFFVYAMRLFFRWLKNKCRQNLIGPLEKIERWCTDVRFRRTLYWVRRKRVLHRMDLLEQQVMQRIGDTDNDAMWLRVLRHLALAVVTFINLIVYFFLGIVRWQNFRESRGWYFTIDSPWVPGVRGVIFYNKDYLRLKYVRRVLFLRCAMILVRIITTLCFVGWRVPSSKPHAFGIGPKIVYAVDKAVYSILSRQYTSLSGLLETTLKDNRIVRLRVQPNIRELPPLPSMHDLYG